MKKATLRRPDVDALFALWDRTSKIQKLLVELRVLLDTTQPDDRMKEAFGDTITEIAEKIRDEGGNLLFDGQVYRVQSRRLEFAHRGMPKDKPAAAKAVRA